MRVLVLLLAVVWLMACGVGAYLDAQMESPRRDFERRVYWYYTATANSGFWRSHEGRWWQFTWNGHAWPVMVPSWRPIVER